MYSEQEIKLLHEKYTKNPTQETVEELVKELGKSKKSIIGKLSREGIYQKIQYKTKTGEDPITKKELVHQISNKLSIDLLKVEGLEKAPKQALKTLLNAI